MADASRIQTDLPSHVRRLIASDINPRQLLYAAVHLGLVDALADGPASST